MQNQFPLAECHLFRMFDKNILFNVDTMLFYEVTPLVCDLISLLRNPNHSDPVKSLKRQYHKADILNALAYLEQEGFVGNGRRAVPNGRRAVPLTKRWGIRHLELMVTHGCNMACRYCYGSMGREEWKDCPYLYGAHSSDMSLETAKKGVDYLFRASGGRKDLSIIFFGGEPLLAFRLIEQITPYIREKEKATGKNVSLSLSTNGFLLTQRIVDFLVKNRIGCQVSIDGPPEIQDHNRPMPTGKGSYERILPGIKRLIAARPDRVPARVTVAHGNVDLPAVVEHLLKLGFGSVHIEPAIGSSGALTVSREDVEAMKKQNEQLALFLVRSVRRNRYFNYTNLVKFIRQTRVVRDRLAHYCGAGRTYFALSQDGYFYPCHRFVGLEEYRMGHVDNGMDVTLQKKILNLSVDNRPKCKDCWARYLCGGGCWKHAVDVNGCLEVPDNEFSCEIIRHEIECAMAINSKLKVEDKDILSNLYEKDAEPYLVADKGVTDVQS